jgi:hypothetical protein
MVDPNSGDGRVKPGMEARRTELIVTAKILVRLTADHNEVGRGS